MASPKHRVQGLSPTLFVYRQESEEGRIFFVMVIFFLSSGVTVRNIKEYLLLLIESCSFLEVLLYIIGFYTLPSPYLL